MLFQLIKRKSCEHFGEYCNNSIVDNLSFQDGDQTWSYDPIFENNKLELAQFYVNGKTLSQACPDHLKDKLKSLKDKHYVFLKCFKHAKLDERNYCFYDLVPESFLKDYFQCKNDICEYIFNTTEKSNNYDLLYKLNIIINKIVSQRLNLDLDRLSRSNEALQKKLQLIKPYINYNIFGSITGRLTTKPKSFPILTISKKYRNIIKPNNDFFIELDFNSAELRSLLGLNNISQPNKDIHEWHQSLYANNISRDEIKQKFFAWLYRGNDDKFGISEIDDAYNRKEILSKYYSDGLVITPFGRKIKSDHRRALSLLNQSTSADVFSEQIIKVYSLLNNCKTKIAFTIHDSLILDYSREDKALISKIKNTFSDTRYGKYLINMKLGDNFGNMKKI